MINSLRLSFLISAFCICASNLFSQTNWTRQNIERKDTIFYGMAFTDTNTGYVVGTDGTMYRTTDAGTTWVFKPLPTALKLTAIHFPTSSVGFIVGETGTILKTTDAGGNWSALDAGTKATLFAVHFLDEDSGFVAGQSGELLYTNDKGATWTQMDGKFDGNNIYSMSFPTPKVGFICGNAGKVSRTTNGGRTWQSQDSKFTFSLFSISFGNANIGTMVGGGGTIRHTTNAGRNWVEQFTTVPLTSYSFNAVQHLDSARAYIAGWIGIVLYKNETDQMWTALDNSYADPLECMHFFNQKEGYVGGWNSTILKTTNGGGSVLATPPVQEPVSVLLHQNAPNPVRLTASRSTRIPFDVRTAGRTTLKVYSALGTELATILDEDLAPGHYVRNWAIPGLPSGAYYCVLRNGVTTAGRTLTIIR
jgi:photosystem II stability/assembly factor-like uncharacterized protein